MTDSGPRALIDALTAAATGLPDVERRAIGGGTEWIVRGRPFAAVTGAVAAFRLEPTIGRAALGTPDTAPSGRGSDWIEFRPVQLDRFALDRAIAWFGSAHRRASALRN